MPAAQAFPAVLFESCSGGGGRFDPALLYYMPQVWTSDNTDALARIKIQYGTSLAYPASASTWRVLHERKPRRARHGVSSRARGRLAWHARACMADAVSAHVTKSPNEQNGRSTSLTMRGASWLRVTRRVRCWPHPKQWRHRSAPVTPAHE